MNILNKKPIINKFDYPYKIWTIDNFLKKEVINKIKDDFPSNRMIDGKENILEQGMMSISDFNLIPTYSKNIFEYFYSDKFIQIMEDMTGLKNLTHDNQQWSGLRIMKKNAFQLIHSDARQHPENKLRKEVTCLLYLHKENYIKEKDEGCLEVWDDNMTNKIHEIEPLNNRLLIFLNSDTSYHGVPKVLTERKALLFNYCKKNTHLEDSRSKALFKKRPEDSQYIEDLGLSRSKIK